MNPSLIHTQGWCVYLLHETNRRDDVPKRQGNRTTYVGMTNHMAERLAAHNNGESFATRHATWNLIAAAPMTDRDSAAILERWLKCGNSGQKRRDFAAAFNYTSYHRTERQQAILNAAALWNARRHLSATITRSATVTSDPKET